MTTNEMPLTEQVGELKAKGEDRLEAALVPRMEALLSTLVASAATMRDRISNWRPVRR